MLFRLISVSDPGRLIEKCLASNRIVIDTVISKYCNHTPLCRQSLILERDIGLEVSRAKLDGWVLKVGELLIPMVAAMRRELMSGTYRRMKLRSMCICAKAEERTTEPICGSTADPEGAWCSTSV